jgi:hypothetical protein
MQVCRHVAIGSVLLTQQKVTTPECFKMIGRLLLSDQSEVMPIFLHTSDPEPSGVSKVNIPSYFANFNIGRLCNYQGWML